MSSDAVPSTVAVVLRLADVKGTGGSGKSFVAGGPVGGEAMSGVVTPGATTPQQTTGHITTVLHTGEDRQIAMAAMEVIAEVGRLRHAVDSMGSGESGKLIAPTSASLSTPSVQEHIAQLVQQRLIPQQSRSCVRC